MDQASVLDNPKYTYLIKKQSAFFRVWKKLFYYYTKFVFLWYTPLKVYGRENIPNTSFIYSCNHNSHMDVALLAASVNKVLIISECWRLKITGLITGSNDSL
jgi:1-acyl-sn-glycerol-3-phosphate acyltransferase